MPHFLEMTDGICGETGSQATGGKGTEKGRTRMSQEKGQLHYEEKLQNFGLFQFRRRTNERDTYRENSKLGAIR